MKTKLPIVVSLALALTALFVGAVIAQGLQRPLAAAPSAAGAPSAVAQAQVADVLHRSPVMFIQNAGRLPAAPQQPHLPGSATSPQEGSTPALSCPR